MLSKSRTAFFFALLVACPFAIAQDVPVLTVCEALQNRELYSGKSVIVVGRHTGTFEGTWLSEDCGLKFELQGRLLDPFISTTNWPDDYDAAPPLLPKRFRWDKKLLKQKVAQVEKTTRLGKDGEWVAIFGRLEVRPMFRDLSDGRRKERLGFGHLGAAVAELVSPIDGSGYKRVK